MFLSYVQKDALIAFVTPVKYSEVEQKLRVSLRQSKVNLKDIKKYLATGLTLSRHCARVRLAATRLSSTTQQLADFVLSIAHRERQFAK